MATKKRKPRRQPKDDKIQELRAEMVAALKHLAELLATRPSQNAIEEVRRECSAEFQKLQLRITEAFDAKPLAYLDSQRVATLHNRMAEFQRLKDVDQAEVQNHKGRIRTLEAASAREANAFFKFKRAGFWKRLSWVLFGASHKTEGE